MRDEEKGAAAKKYGRRSCVCGALAHGGATRSDPTWRESARPLAKWSWEEERIDARGRGEWDRSHPGK